MLLKVCPASSGVPGPSDPRPVRNRCGTTPGRRGSSRDFEALKTRVALYPRRMDSCEVDGEQVTSQDGDFYGGWITPQIVGPFKGGPGTAGW